MNRKKRNNTTWVIPVLIVLILTVLFFGVNDFGAHVMLNGPEQVILEYGSTYQDPGATADFGGKLFLKAQHPLEVKTRGGVDTDHLGKYEIKYIAQYAGFRKSVSRIVNVVDTTPPEIHLMNNPELAVYPEEAYVEEGFTAVDAVDGDLTKKVSSREEDGKVYYTVTDASGNTAQVVRKILYVDIFPPEIKLTGGDHIEVPAGEEFRDPGFSAMDEHEGDLTKNVSVSGTVDPYHAGSYELTYTVADSKNNTATVTRQVNVVPKPQAEIKDPGEKVVYLTFDDGPGQHTQELLDILDRYNVKVTFFVTASGDPDLIGEEARRGHSVGIHSASHDYDQIYASEKAYFADLNKMAAIIREQTGKDPTLLRFPGGSSNTISNFNPGIMSRLTSAVQDAGYQYFDWNVSSGDAGETTQTDRVVQNVINGIQDQDISVVLQHDIKGFSVAAVEQIVSWGLANGYTFLPLTSDSPTMHHPVNN